MKDAFLSNLSKVKNTYIGKTGYPIYELEDGRVFVAVMGSQGVYWQEAK